MLAAKIPIVQCEIHALLQASSIDIGRGYIIQMMHFYDVSISLCMHWLMFEKLHFDDWAAEMSFHFDSPGSAKCKNWNIANQSHSLQSSDNWEAN